MIQQANEIRISYKEKIRAKDRTKITSSGIASKLLYSHWDKDTIEFQESFKVLLLNNANKVKGIYNVSKGGITGTMVDIRILFAVVLKSLSVGIILAHNHPSGGLKPSSADKALTKKIRNAAKLLDITVLDHIIVNPKGDYFSFADQGLL
jgi:DNA repair protein RadC